MPPPGSGSVSTSNGRGAQPKPNARSLHAATLDHTFLPSWTLANFYFRQARQGLFWTYARAASSVYQDDLSGVFQPRPPSRSQSAQDFSRLSPPHPRARLDLMRTLLDAGRIGDAARTADLAAAVPVRGTTDLLLAACDESIARGLVPQAIAFWNAAARNGLIARHLLDPAGGVSSPTAR
jgi:hypothetical protein